MMPERFHMIWTMSTMRSNARFARWRFGVQPSAASSQGQSTVVKFTEAQAGIAVVVWNEAFRSTATIPIPTPRTVDAINGDFHEWELGASCSTMLSP